jgi:non-lysosomal glucosylceramidase
MARRLYSKKVLRNPGPQRRFSGEAREVAFPLGGIGTGNVSIGARGELRDWEIWNRSAKGQRMPYGFFSVAVKRGFNVETRVLESRLTPPFTESHGFHPSTAAGLPRFKSSSLRGEYPFCWVDLKDPEMPITVNLEAYTPLIPHEPEDSGIPCAVLTYTIKNICSEPVEVTVVGSLTNLVGYTGVDQFGALKPEGLGGNINEFREEPGVRGLYLWSQKYKQADVLHGSLALVTTNPSITSKRHWLRSGWWDLLREFWDDLQDGELTDLGYTDPSPEGKTDVASLAAVETINPGEEKVFRYILAWHFPNRVHNWNQRKCDCGGECATVRNRYAARFDDAWDVARYVVDTWSHLDGMTRAFHDAFFNSTLPPYVLDAASANIAALRSNTCFWLEDGSFLAYEGCFDDAGCCSGSCTHVWNYEQTLAYLFPSLERSMRETEFRLESESDGRMSFRAYRVFPGEHSWDAVDPASDGQLGSIMRVYREWMISGDTGWVGGLWPAVKRSMEYSIRTWDPDEDGVTDGRQHNTYDIQFYGPNPLTGILYLGALKAAKRIAEASGDYPAADRYNTILAKGSRKLNKLLWNGEYYEQRLPDVDAYKYQHGVGCLADQLLGQINAHLSGLSYLLPPRRVKKAVAAIYKYNLLTGFTRHDNCQRTYVLNDEAGLLACTWPHGGRPMIPFPYSHEVWTGIEYQVATHLISEGLIDEGLTLVKAVRDRHDGFSRNPWNEVECGHHYARSMSSWGTLLALSGFHCNMIEGKISFNPNLPGDFRCFWSTGTAWGTYTLKLQSETKAKEEKIEVIHGTLKNIKTTTTD